MSEQLAPTNIDESLASTGSPALTILEQVPIEKIITRVNGIARTRPAGNHFYIGTEESGTLANVWAEQMDPRYTPDNPRTKFLARALGSAITVAQEVSPPVTDPAELEGIALGFAEAAIAAQAIIQLRVNS